ncbi:hypothetical protein A2V49_01425 [candidate division WWE3 bacterium RBG_19FT_COMBO_34_6]|uniref:DUF192 domain-containing protein n=1 Tax=candidate division WWE3 bacterium RBG_19FT_COMBO_34_6 TaxID=1802612 RepID=A0A1F4UM09_UNCKA|nr:MAG: hypothetical protein A2V49_01425 [candidate division WWE3 bacterium RBG_19FT_COMBO_34_6]
MRKKNLLLILIPIACFVVSIIFYLHNNNYAHVIINDYSFELKIANSLSKQTKGLMYVNNLAEKNGVIFIFDNNQNNKLWMKNTIIPLDMIWVNDRDEIIYIQKNAQPCAQKICRSYGSNDLSKYIIEINAGLCDKYDINIGDKVAINFPKNIF